jgi:threonine synthase
MMHGSARVEAPAKTELRCTACGGLVHGFACHCPACGGLVEAVYPEPSLPLERARDSIERWFGSLPVDDLASCRLCVVPTPLVELAPIGGVRLFAKVEGVLPTGTTKDRLAAVAFPFMLERGVRRFVFSSTGNTAHAYAHALRAYPELRARAFVSEAASLELGPCPLNLELVRVAGDYVEASARARAAARADGWVLEGGFFNVGRREGAKLAYLEALDQLARLGVEPVGVVQAIASGLGIRAAARAVAELRDVGRLGAEPRLYCAQQSTCAPMVEMFHAESQGQPRRVVIDEPEGIAPAMLLGDPSASYAHVAEVVRASGGDFLPVARPAIEAALAKAQPEGVLLGPSAAVALAAAMDLCRDSDPARARWRPRAGDALLVMLTGGPGR